MCCLHHVSTSEAREKALASLLTDAPTHASQHSLKTREGPSWFEHQPMRRRQEKYITVVTWRTTGKWPLLIRVTSCVEWGGGGNLCHVATTGLGGRATSLLPGPCSHQPNLYTVYQYAPGVRGNRGTAWRRKENLGAS